MTLCCTGKIKKKRYHSKYNLDNDLLFPMKINTYCNFPILNVSVDLRQNYDLYPPCLHHSCTFPASMNCKTSC